MAQWNRLSIARPVQTANHHFPLEKLRCSIRDSPLAAMQFQNIHKYYNKCSQCLLRTNGIPPIPFLYWMHWQRFISRIVSRSFNMEIIFPENKHFVLFSEFSNHRFIKRNQMKSNRIARSNYENNFNSQCAYSADLLVPVQSKQWWCCSPTFSTNKSFNEKQTNSSVFYCLWIALCILSYSHKSIRTQVPTHSQVIWFCTLARVSVSHTEIPNNLITCTVIGVTKTISFFICSACHLTSIKGMDNQPLFFCVARDDFIFFNTRTFETKKCFSHSFLERQNKYAIAHFSHRISILSLFALTQPNHSNAYFLMLAGIPNRQF